jgi:hypothetical protein
MINILYLARNIKQNIDFLHELGIELSDNDCFHTYNREAQAIQTKYATLYAKPINANLDGLLHQINYLAYGFDFGELAPKQVIEIQGLIKELNSIKYAREVIEISESKIFEILTGRALTGE